MQVLHAGDRFGCCLFYTSLELGLILFLLTTLVLALAKMLLVRLSAGEGKKS